MAQYNEYADVKNNPLFIELVKDMLGLDNVEDVNPLDQNALFYAFKFRMSDFDADDNNHVIGVMQNSSLEEVDKYAQERFGKPSGQLNNAERIFAILSFYDRNQALEKENKSELKVGNDENSENEKSKIEDTENNLKDEPEQENEPEKDYQRKNLQLDDAARIRSAYSDSNEQWIRWEKLAALKEMGIVSEELPQMLDAETTVDLMLKYEPELTEEQAKEMTDMVTAKILADERLFESVPPSVLSAMYEDFKAQAAAEQDEEKREPTAANLNKVAGRMDELAEMAAKDKELYFSDVTNIADVYSGYNRMFVARYNDLVGTAANGETDGEKSSASEKLQHYQNMMEVVASKISEYDNVYNLKTVSSENAEDLDKRFKQIRKTMEGVEISPETAQLAANFKFLSREYFTLDAEQLQALQKKFPNKNFSKITTYDALNSAETALLEEQGLMPQAEPQFVDKDGNVSDQYSEGAKVIPDSKLGKAILAAKQSVMLENLGADTEITPEFLQQELDAQLPKTLYTLHVVDAVNQGAMENPDQYTNPAYLEHFKAQLSNVERPMAIGPTSFEAGLDNIVNQTGGYAERLAQRLSVDKDGNAVQNPNINVATKLFEPIASIDKNAKDRIAMKQSGKQDYWKTVGKTFLSSATMSCAIRLVGTAAQTATGLTYAAPLVGSILGVGLTTWQIRKWNKQRKEAGLGTGFKDFIKDRRMVMTVATTTLGCAATACMAFPGAQPLGLALGATAMAIGAVNGSITAYKAARASGESKWKSILKAAGVVGASALGALSGKVAADTAIDAYNKYNPENEIFRHNEEVATKHKISDGTPETKETVIDRDALEADSKRYNEQYNISDRVHHGMSHDDYMSAVDDYNKAHPDAPINNPDELLKGAYNSQNGRVYGPGYVAEHGLDPDVVKSVGNLINSDGSINPDAVEAWNSSDLWKESGLKNFVQTVNEPVELRPDLYPNRTPESTYSGVDMPTKEIVHEATAPVYEYGKHYELADNARPLGFATVGVMGGAVVQHKTLKDRIGSLLDRIRGKDKQPSDNIPPQDVVPPQDKTKTAEPTDQPAAVPSPAKKQVQNDELRPVEGKTVIVPPPALQNMLVDEFKIVYNSEPSSEALLEYRKLVQYEFNKAIIEKTTKSATMQEYLQERKTNFERQLAENLGVKNLDGVKKSEIDKVVDKARDIAMNNHTGSMKDFTLTKVGENLTPGMPQSAPQRQEVKPAVVKSSERDSK